MYIQIYDHYLSFVTVSEIRSAVIFADFAKIPCHVVNLWWWKAMATGNHLMKQL